MLKCEEKINPGLIIKVNQINTLKMRHMFKDINVNFYDGNNYNKDAINLTTCDLKFDLEGYYNSKKNILFIGKNPIKMNSEYLNYLKYGKRFDIKRLFMDIGRYSLFPLYLFMPYKIIGRKDLLKYKNGAIIVANHFSFIDPILMIRIFIRRRLYSLVGEEIIDKSKFRAFFLKGGGCIRIDRNNQDTKTLKYCVNLLKADNLLLVFPQGHIVKDDDLSELKGGPAMLSLMANKPIIPIYFKKNKRQVFKYSINIGNMITPQGVASKDNIDDLTDNIRVALESLKQELE